MLCARRLLTTNSNWLRSVSSQRWLVTMSNSQEFIVSKRQARNVGHILSW